MAWSSGCVRVPATDPHIVEMNQRLIVPTQNRSAIDGAYRMATLKQ